MGLTGHILEVEFQMQRIPSPWIWQESEQVPDLDTALERLQAAGTPVAVHGAVVRLPRTAAPASAAAC